MNYKKIVGISILLLSLAIYSFGACRTNPGYADSDEIITEGFVLGVAHPPGYPLQIFLTHFFENLPIPGTVAFRANLLSSLLQSLTLFVFYFVCLKLLAKISKSEKLNVVVSAFASLTLGFSTIFWLYAGVTEVGPLGNFLLVISLWLALSWEQKINEKKYKHSFCYLSLTAIILGIALSHLQPLVLVLPGFALFFILTIIKEKNWKKQMLVQIPWSIFLVIAFFLLINLLLFLLNGNKEDYSWYFEQNWKGWWGQITREAYSGYKVEENINAPAYFSWENLDIDKHLRGIPEYIYFLGEHFSAMAVVLGVLGMSFLWGKNRKLFYILFTLFVFPGFLFGIYMGYPPADLNNLRYRTEVGITHRQYLLGEVLFAFLIAFGAIYVYRFLEKKIRDKKKAEILFYSILAGIVIYNVFTNYKASFKRNYTIANDYAKEVLSQLEENSVVICAADFSCFALAYVQEVEGFRTDVAVIGKAKYIKKHFLDKNPQYIGFDYPDNPYYLADLLTWNAAIRPTYITDLQDFYINFIGLDVNPFILEPVNYAFKVVKKVPENFSRHNYQTSKALLALDKSNKNYWQVGLQDYFANFHVTAGLLYSYYGQKDLARENLKLTTDLNPGYRRGKELYDSLIGFSGMERYSQGKESSSSAYYYKAAQDKIKENNLTEAYNNFRKASYLEPLNRDYRIAIAKIYEQGRYYELAAWEYEYLLKYYPEDTEAKAALERVRSIL